MSSPDDAQQKTRPMKGNRILGLGLVSALFAIPVWAQSTGAQPPNLNFPERNNVVIEAKARREQILVLGVRPQILASSPSIDLPSPASARTVTRPPERPTNLQMTPDVVTERLMPLPQIIRP